MHESLQSASSKLGDNQWFSLSVFLTLMTVSAVDPVRPPKDIRLQLSTDGSQSLHVTWTPVDPKESPDCIPTGYKVYIDGISASHVSGADSSSAYINQFTISTLYTAEPHKVHVKTVWREGESTESDIVTFTSDMLAGSSDSSTEEHTDELRDSGVYSRGEKHPPASTGEEKSVEISGLQSEEIVNKEEEEEEDVEEDVDAIVQSVKAEMSQQQQRQAEVVNVAASQVPVTGGMLTIAGEDGESETESSNSNELDSEPEALEVFASPDKSEASMSRDDELSDGEIAIPVEPVEQTTTEVKLVDVKPQPSLIRSVRKFTALFDYDPVTMSPNEDGAEEELSFKKGNVITVSYLEMESTHSRCPTG